MTRAVSSRFSPRSLEPAQLERLTVAREELLARLERVVTDAVVTGQARFDLLLGPRGAGKSHCIGLLEARLRASPQLSGRTIIVAPPEELHPTSLVAFLAAVLREFPDDADVGPVDDALRSLQRQQDGNQEQRAVDLIRARLGNRALVILLENLDELFDMLGREGQQRLRNILQTQRRWSIIASSRSLSPAFVKYEAPFHGTFNQHPLEPLSPEQCRDMLAALAVAHGQIDLEKILRAPKGMARVRGIHHLLGGNPRAMTFMFRQLDEQRLDHFELALADLADELKPYFQEQMTRQSPAQRAIMELLAESWRPLTVTEIAERGFISQASTSGALRNLRRDALVQERKLGREHFYELGDPLHRLARANERPREAIEAFARVIRWWYSDDTGWDFSYRRRYVLPNFAITAAGEGELGPSYVAATTQQAMDLHRLPPARAVEQARARLAKQESPATRAVLVLALERAGDEEAAVDEFLAALGPHGEMTSAYVLDLASIGTPRAEGAAKNSLESPIARALQLVDEACRKPGTVEVRRALLTGFERASPTILRLLSEQVAHSSLLVQWTLQREYADLGVLLGRMRPVSDCPSLEAGLPFAIFGAWHHGRLAELVRSLGSLKDLLPVLPRLQRVVTSMVIMGEIADVPRLESLRALVLGGDAPEPALRDPDLLMLISPIMLDAVYTACEGMSDDNLQAMFGAVSKYLPGVVPSWLASRRSPRRLWQIAEQLSATVFLDLFPMLQTDSPREALARLPEPERELVRKILEMYDDREGLAELGFTPRT
jgi:DNA-binding transcriptional ArsR family regulator